MATVIGVGMQMTASAAGMTRGLSDADRALQLLQKIVEQNQQTLAKFGQQATKTSSQLESLTQTTSLLARIEIGRLLIDGAQAIAGAFSSIATQVSGLVANVNSSIDTLNDLSARTGIGVEQLQKYAFAAKLAGVDTAEFGTAVQKLAVNIGKATPGGELDKSLQAINLSVTQLRALAPEQQFSVIGQAISQLPTAADRAAASVAIFGKQGAALAPLFREGAASIEELQARAERLGIIISETQVNNVADMNDAFDTVRATIDGIIGQVIGNLAPAVTAVTEEFLKFVESWSGAQGTGGTGIANAITDVLLRGAEYFAGIFDGFIENLGSLAEAFAFSADVFDVAGKLLFSTAEGLRAAFNAIQIGIDALLIGFGRIVQELGSYVSDDLETFGESLASASEASAKKNSAEMEAAAANAANTFAGIFNDVGDNAQQNGQGAASRFVTGLRQGIEEARRPEVVIATNAEELRERFDDLFNGLNDQSNQATAAMQDFEQAMAAAHDDGVLTTSEIAKIADLQSRVNAALDQESQLRQAARDAAIAQAKADEQRIANLTKANDAQSKIVEDIAAVERELLRVQQDLNTARDAGNRRAADQAAARLAQLDQLQANLQDQQQAFDQGFGDGFTKAFEATNKSIEGVIAKAAEFGNAGAEAALKFQEGVALVQQQARDGILNNEAYELEIERQRALFDRQLTAIRQEEQEKLAAAQRVDAFLKNGIDARRQAELAAAKELEDRKKQAALNVAEIQKQIDAEERANEEAREKGNLRAARDSATRLRSLRGLRRDEDAIANGSTRRVQQTFSRAAQQQNNVFNSFANAATRQVQQFNNAVSSTINDVNQALAQSAEGLAKVARQQRASLMLGPQQIAVSDVRTAEGQQMVLAAAAQYQDPVLIQMRQQSKILSQIATGLTQNLNRIGIPAQLL